MPFEFDPHVTDRLDPEGRSIEDRRNNPVRGRRTRFRLLQRSMLAYTYSDFIPGFAEAGINGLPIQELVRRPTDNARREGDHLFGGQFSLHSNSVAKVEGDVFENLIAAVLWNTAARWNEYMATGVWPARPRYHRPELQRSLNRQIAVLSLPRRFDWVRLLVDGARQQIDAIRETLRHHELSLPTSTPDVVIVALPEEYRDLDRFRRELPDLSRNSQEILSNAYRAMLGRIEPGELLLAVALKKSLRSDRLYQPLYEANIMQLLLEGKLGAPQVEFEVYTLASVGTGARRTYSAASLGAVATDHAQPHRAVRELYEPESAEAVVRRLLQYLEHRVGQIDPAV